MLYEHSKVVENSFMDSLFDFDGEELDTNDQ